MPGLSRVATRKARNAAAANALSMGAGKRSKTGSPMCSQAMSAWVKSRHGGPPVVAEVFKVLAKCRQMANQNKRATTLQAAGKLAEGRGTWQRSEQAAALRAQRNATRPAPPTPKVSKATPKVAPRSKPRDVDAPPADWRERLAKVRAAKQAKGGNLTDDELRRVLPDEVKAKPKAKPAPAPKPTTQPGSTPPPVGISRERLASARAALKAPVPDAIKSRVIEALRAEDPQHADKGAPASIRSLRERLKDILPRKSQFDRVIRKLQDEGDLNLHRDDAPFVFTTTPADRFARSVRRGMTGRTRGEHGLARRNAMDYHIAASMSEARQAQIAGEKTRAQAPASTRKPRRSLAEKADYAEALRDKLQARADQLGPEHYERAMRLSARATQAKEIRDKAKRILSKKDQADLRAKRAAEIVAARKRGAAGTAADLRTLPLNHEQQQAERIANRFKRNTKNAELLREHLAKGGTATYPAMAPMRPRIYTHPDSIVGASKAHGDLLVREGGRRVVSVNTTFDQGRALVFPARQAKAQELRAAREAARAQAASQPVATGTPKPKPKRAGSGIVRDKTIDLAEAKRLRERPTTIEGEDFARRKDMKGQASLLDRVTLDHAGAKAPGRHSLDRVSLAQRLKKARAGGRGQARSYDLNRERFAQRALHNARVDYRREQEAAASKAKPPTTSTSTPTATKAKQRSMFDHKDAPADPVKEMSRADRIWALGQKQKAAGDINATGTFTRHDELMSHARRLIEARRGPDERRDAGKGKATPPAAAATAPTPSQAEIKRSHWRALIESARKEPGAKRDKQAARLKSLRGERARGVRELDAASIATDPERFQYKLAHGPSGSVGSLSGVKKWDPERAGILQVWRDPADGKTYVVNGHNRLDLAKRAGAKVTAQYIKAKDATEARAKGAITNIAEGRGTAIDAAKFLRDQGLSSRADFDALDLPVREKVATDGIALAGLEPRAFRAVIDGDLPVSRAAIIGGSGLSHSEQRAVIDLASKRGKGSEISDKHLRELIHQAKLAGSARKGGGGLFGDDPEEQSLLVHRAAIVSHVKDRLAREKKVFGTVSKSRNAEALKRGNNVIDTEESGKISAAAAANLATFDQMQRLRGSTAALIAEGEQRLASREPRDKVYADIYKRLRKALREDGG